MRAAAGSDLDPDDPDLHGLATTIHDLTAGNAFGGGVQEVLASIRAKDMNLMLHDLEREPEVAIVDLDALAAELGGQRNLPDGLHSSGALQTELRGEIVHMLSALGVPGFAPTPAR